MLACKALVQGSTAGCSALLSRSAVCNQGKEQSSHVRGSTVPGAGEGCERLSAGQRAAAGWLVPSSCDHQEDVHLPNLTSQQAAYVLSEASSKAPPHSDQPASFQS